MDGERRPCHRTARRASVTGLAHPTRLRARVDGGRLVRLADHDERVTTRRQHVSTARRDAFLRPRRCGAGEGVGRLGLGLRRRLGGRRRGGRGRRNGRRRRRRQRRRRCRHGGARRHGRGCDRGLRRRSRVRRRRRRGRRLDGYRRGHRDGGRRRRRLGVDGRRRRGRARGQEPERVDVALLLGCSSDTEMDARHGLLRRPAGPHRPDRLALGDRVSLRDPDRAQMDERHRIPVRREDRDAAAVRRQRAGKRDHTGGRRADRSPVGAGDVDPAVLAACVRVSSEHERPQYLTLRGPRPGRRAAAQGEREHAHGADREKTVHCAPPQFSATATRERKGSDAVGRRQSGRSSDAR